MYIIPYLYIHIWGWHKKVPYLGVRITRLTVFRGLYWDPQFCETTILARMTCSEATGHSLFI